MVVRRRRKDLVLINKAAHEQGWRSEYTKSGHIRFLGPSGQIVVLASSPGDSREMANVKALLRRAGMRI